MKDAGSDRNLLSETNMPVTCNQRLALRMTGRLTVVYSPADRVESSDISRSCTPVIAIIVRLSSRQHLSRFPRYSRYYTLDVEIHDLIIDVYIVFVEKARIV